MNLPKNLRKMKWKALFFIPFFIIVSLLFSFHSAGPDQEDDDEFVVVLDAGHGGHDPGNLGNGYLEKNIALNIVLHVGSILKQNSNIKVVYTRSDDTFVDLYVRGEIANKANADLFVSVHCDSHTSDAHGAGTFVLGLHANEQNFEIAKKENSVIYLEDNYEDRYADYDINSPESVIGLTIMQEEFLDQSIALAKNMQENFSGKLKRKDREVKQAGFIVLHQTFMPSVLIETGFLTNKDEGAYLNSRQGQAEMGTAIADAILRYRAGVQSNSAPFTVSSTSSTTAESTIDDSAIKTENKELKKMEAQTLRKAKKDQIEKDRLAEETRIAKAVETAKKEKDALAEKKRLAEEEAKKQELARLTENRRKAEAAKKAQEEKEEKDRLAEEAKKAEELQAEKDRLAEEAKNRELAQIEKQRKEAAAAKIDQDALEKKERLAEAAKKAEEAQAEKDRIAEEAKNRESDEIAQKEAQPVESEVTKEATSNTDVVFKVQLMASVKTIPLEAKNFNGLNKLSKEPVKNLFRYMYGNVKTYEEAKTLKSDADSKGYTTSYIVAYKDGQRITIKEARKYVKE